jgi:hypothetical protein
MCAGVRDRWQIEHKTELLWQVPHRQAEVQLAGYTTTLHDVPVLTNRVGKTFDDFCGTLGLDSLQEFSAFTLDFHNMQLDLR